MEVRQEESTKEDRIAMQFLVVAVYAISSEFHNPNHCRSDHSSGRNNFHQDLRKRDLLLTSWHRPEEITTLNDVTKEKTKARCKCRLRVKRDCAEKHSDWRHLLFAYRHVDVTECNSYHENPEAWKKKRVCFFWADGRCLRQMEGDPCPFAHEKLPQRKTEWFGASDEAQSEFLLTMSDNNHPDVITKRQKRANFYVDPNERFRYRMNESKKKQRGQPLDAATLARVQRESETRRMQRRAETIGDDLSSDDFLSPAGAAKLQISTEETEESEASVNEQQIEDIMADLSWPTLN